MSGLLRPSGRSGRLARTGKNSQNLTLALPTEVEHWSLTTLREKLVKIGAKVVRHGRYVTFQLAEVAVERRYDFPEFGGYLENVGLSHRAVASSDNEGKACDAVLRLLEERTGKVRADVSHPEKDGIGPPVELRLKLGTQSYAFEHTQIEAFAGQIHTGEEFGQFIRPVIDELSGTLPKPGVYHLYFPNNTRLGVKADQREKIRSDFIEWVREHAKRLHENNPEKPTRGRNPRGFDEEYRAKPPGFPYEVTLQREAHWSLSSRHDGVLLPARYAPENVEALRAARLQQALERKCPKLQRCKEDGARTILILEDGDISLSNHVLFQNGLASLLEKRAGLPDEIYLVETAVDRWAVRLMKCDESCFPDEDWTKFDSAELTDITNAAADQDQ